MRPIPIDIDWESICVNLSESGVSYKQLKKHGITKDLFYRLTSAKPTQKPRWDKCLCVWAAACEYLTEIQIVSCISTDVNYKKMVKKPSSEKNISRNFYFNRFNESELISAMSSRIRQAKVGRPMFSIAIKLEKAQGEKWSDIAIESIKPGDAECLMLSNYRKKLDLTRTQVVSGWRIASLKGMEFPMGSCIYVMKGAGKYKIGLTANLNKRFSALKLSSPVKIELVRTVVCVDGAEASKNVESLIHNDFKGRRSHGEWFNLNYADLEKIDSMCQPWLVKYDKPSQALVAAA